jgi:hypothetical protein
VLPKKKHNLSKSKLFVRFYMTVPFAEHAKLMFCFTYLSQKSEQSLTRNKH